MSKFTNFAAYNKHQAILTSGRLIFNAREDNLFLLAKKDLAISVGQDVHINVGVKGSTTSKLIINSPRVQFGLPSNSTKMEPVAKGDSAVESVSELLAELSKFLNILTSAKGLVSGGVATLPEVNLAADAFMKKLPDLKKGLDKIKSTTTFTN